MQISRSVDAERMVMSIEARGRETYTSSSHVDEDAFIRLTWARDASLDISLTEAAQFREYLAAAIAEVERVTGETTNEQKKNKKGSTNNGI